MKSCVEKVMAQGKDESSAHAICTTSLQDAGEPIFEGAESRALHLLGAMGLARKVVEAGKNWLVIPVVALMEGVIHAVNASTPEFVPLSTLKQAAASWNGKPVTLGHPKRDGKQCSADAPDILEAHGIGIIKNSRVEGTKLLQDVWIDCERAKKLHPEMLARLEANKTEEVSVGAFVSTDGKADQFNGKPYMASWLEAMGDHLAFLPGGRGACSVAMGCGTHRAAMRVCEDALEDVAPAAEFVSAFFRSLLPRGWGDDEVKQDLRDALYAIDSVARNGEILRVTNNEIIYCVYPKPDMLSPYPVEPQKMTYWKRGYSYDSATKSFTLSPDRVQVEPTTVYEELRAAAGKKPAYKDCPTCEGLGSMGGNPCPTCDGTGEMLVKAAAKAVCGCDGPVGTCGCDGHKDSERPIKFEGGRYVLYSQDGHRKLAEHGSMIEAKAHAQAISLALAPRKAS
jgi:hypothetical protein